MSRSPAAAHSSDRRRCTVARRTVGAGETVVLDGGMLSLTNGMNFLGTITDSAPAASRIGPIASVGVYNALDAVQETFNRTTGVLSLFDTQGATVANLKFAGTGDLYATPTSGLATNYIAITSHASAGALPVLHDLIVGEPGGPILTSNSQAPGPSACQIKGRFTRSAVHSVGFCTRATNGGQQPGAQHCPGINTQFTTSRRYRCQVACPRTGMTKISPATAGSIQ